MSQGPSAPAAAYRIVRYTFMGVDRVKVRFDFSTEAAMMIAAKAVKHPEIVITGRERY